MVPAPGAHGVRPHVPAPSVIARDAEGQVALAAVGAYRMDGGPVVVAEEAPEYVGGGAIGLGDGFHQGGAAGDADRHVGGGFNVRVHVLFAAGACAAHAYVFDCAAEAGAHVPLEVRHRHKRLRVVDGAGDFNFLEMFAAVELHADVVASAKPVGYDYGRAHHLG